MSVTPEDLHDFNRFVGEQLAGDGAETLVELVHQWAATREREEVNAAIRAGLKAIDEGRTRPFDESQDEFRAAHNLPPRRWRDQSQSDLRPCARERESSR